MFLRYFRQEFSNVFSNSYIIYNQYTSSIGSVKTAKKSLKLIGKRSALTLTPAALNRVKHLLSQQSEAKGMRVGVKTRGCNGLTYTLDFATDEEKPGDQLVVIDDIKIFIDKRAQLTLLGTEMDFTEGLTASEFVFNNPNIKGTCGCGESFNI